VGSLWQPPEHDAGSTVRAPPLYTSGTEIVYATNGSTTTGHDTRNFGFVDTPSSHYSWLTPNGGIAVISDAPYQIPITLISDGDFALNVVDASVTPQIYGYYTPAAGDAMILTTPASASYVRVDVHVTVTYDPTTIRCTGSPYGYAYPHRLVAHHRRWRKPRLHRTLHSHERANL